jgi:Undecaprenyl-phosphate glucose phosphotransferase
MLKERRQLFEAFFMFADLLVVGISWFLAYYIRFNTDLIPADKGVPPLGEYAITVVLVWIIWGLVFRWMGLYKAMRGVRPIREFFLLFNANVFSLLILIAIIYLFREKTVPYSRLVFLYFGVISFFFTLFQRGALRFLLRELRRKGYNLRYLLVVGEAGIAEDIISRIKNHDELGIQIVGLLTHDGKLKRGPGGVPVVGSYMDLRAVLAKIQIDQIVVALPLEHNALLPEVMEQIGDNLIDVKIVPDLYQFVTLGGMIEEFEGVPVMSLQSTPLSGFRRFAKRLIDIAASTILLVILSPLMLFIAFLIKCSSRGSVFYRQERVSFDGSKFWIVKFRTMALDAEEEGPGWTVPGDNRVTWLGGLLRSLSLDELPQLINVLRGDMSVVGPRPERPIFIEEFRRRVPKYMLRHKVPAGITGWAQVNGWRGDTSIDKRIEYDLYYIENWSLMLDLKILLLTFLRGFRNRNAY